MCIVYKIKVFFDMKYIFCALLNLYSIFIIHTVFSMEEDRMITFLNHNVSDLSIQFILLRYSTVTFNNAIHSLEPEKEKKWSFAHLELLKKPKLIIKQKDSQQLTFKLSRFEQLLKSNHMITISQQDDSIAVTAKKGKKVVHLSFLLQQEANLSASR